MFCSSFLLCTSTVLSAPTKTCENLMMSVTLKTFCYQNHEGKYHPEIDTGIERINNGGQHLIDGRSGSGRTIHLHSFITKFSSSSISQIEMKPTAQSAAAASAGGDGCHGRSGRKANHERSSPTRRRSPISHYYYTSSAPSPFPQMFSFAI